MTRPPAPDTPETSPAALRLGMLRDLRGTVLEIGPGTGINLADYAPDVHWIGIEPDASYREQVRREATRLGRQVQVLPGRAEDIALPAGSVDAVVGTLVLCSVDDVAASLAEIRRVLRPGGRYVFVEHVAAPRGTWTRCAQTVHAHLIGPFGSGCRVNRDSGTAIDQAGFEAVDVRTYTEPGPLGSAIPHIVGLAR